MASGTVLTNGGASPTLQCCRSVAGVVRTGADSVCLFLTGKVAFGLPINYTLSISLPRICKSPSVPLVCRDTSTQTLAPDCINSPLLTLP
ncbi:hypothetical protein ACQJBY_020261 [Aegilops geniculata]